MRPPNKKTARGSGRRGGSVFGLRRVDCSQTPDDCFVVEGVVSGGSPRCPQRGLWFIVARESMVCALSDESCEVLIEHGALCYRVEVQERRAEVEYRRCAAYRRGGGE
jgi:hypothetical protein